MVSLDGIAENLIAEAVFAIILYFVSPFIRDILTKEKSDSTGKKYDALSVLIFIEIFLVFNFILNMSFWSIPNLTTFLVLTIVAVGYSIYYVLENQCPSCKKIFRAKKTIDRKIKKKFTRVWKYQPEKVWLYSNENEWKRKNDGPEKSRTENWITKQEFYECNFCGHKWDSGHVDVNLDENTRPKTVQYIQTKEKDPDDVI